MSFTKIDSDQLKDNSITDNKIANNAAIDSHKIISSLSNTDLYADLNSISNDVSSKVSKGGDTMTGPLILAADPTSPLEASTKEYVDDNFLHLSGGILTGDITLSADPTAALHPTTKQYVDTNFLPFSGGTLAGSLTLSADPTAALGAATKQYVDNAVAIAAGTTIIPGSFSGFEMEYIDGTHFLVKTGQCASDDALSLISFTSNVTVNLSTNGANGLDTGVISNQKWYTVWGIFDSTNSTNAALVSLSSTAPTLPGTYDRKRKIGSIFTDNTGSILYFTQTVTLNTKVTHITPIDITGAVGNFDLYTAPTYGRAPVSASSVLVDVAIDPASTGASTIIVSEIVEETTPKLIARKTTYGAGNAGEFWVKLLNGKLNLSGSINTAPVHIPIINVVGYMEQL